MSAREAPLKACGFFAPDASTLCQQIAFRFSANAVDVDRNNTVDGAARSNQSFKNQGLPSIQQQAEQSGAPNRSRFISR